MARLADYSKWDHIECSDDEAEDLPHCIDKDSFKKYTKAKRSQRDAEEEKRISELRASVERLRKELRQLGAAGRNHLKGQNMQKQLEAEEKELAKLERVTSRRVNAEKMSTEIYSKSVISSKTANAPKVDDNVDTEKFVEYAKTNNDLLEKLCRICDDLFDEEDHTVSGTTKDHCSTASATPSTSALPDAESTEGGSVPPASAKNTFSSSKPARSKLTAASKQKQLVEKSVKVILEHPEVLLSSDAETFLMFRVLELEIEKKPKEYVHGMAIVAQLIAQALTLSKMIQTGDPGTNLMSQEAGASTANAAVIVNKKAVESMYEKLVVAFSTVTADKTEEREHQELKQSFEQAVSQFVSRIEKRAVEKIKEIEEEERAAGQRGVVVGSNDLTSSSGTTEQKVSTKDGTSRNASTTRTGSERLSAPAAPATQLEEDGGAVPPDEKQIGPGGLDAQEVFDSLPTVLQDAFLEKDAEKLQKAFMSLPSDDAQRYLRKCIDGGLWVVPGSGGDMSRESDDDD